MTALVAISDQSDIAVWDWKGWLIFATVAIIALVASRRSHIRRQSRKRQGKA